MIQKTLAVLMLVGLATTACSAAPSEPYAASGQFVVDHRDEVELHIFSVVGSVSDIAVARSENRSLGPACGEASVNTQAALDFWAEVPVDEYSTSQRLFFEHVAIAADRCLEGNTDAMVAEIELAAEQLETASAMLPS